MKVVLEVPDTIDFQLVYRMERGDRFDDCDPAPYRFLNVDSVAQAIRVRHALVQALGWLGFLRAILKIAANRRSFYLLMADQPISHGRITVGRCKHYYMEDAAAVIGPIWTSPNYRGRGLATVAMKMAVNHHIDQGTSIFYIDTSKHNRAAQRVFANVGFGEPVALYFRRTPGVRPAQEAVDAKSLRAADLEPAGR